MESEDKSEPAPKVNMDDFTDADKESLVRLFVSTPQTLNYIYKSLFT